MNANIIKQFEELINMIKTDFDIQKSKNYVDNSTIYRLKQLKNVLSILKKYPHQLTIDNLAEFKELPGIGKGTIDRIIEILTTGHLKEIKKISKKDNKHEEIINELETVHGIGRKLAIELYEMGVTSIKDLKEKINNSSIKVNNTITKSLLYHNKIKQNIPRKEMDKYYKYIQKIINNLNKDLDDNKYIFEMCGSYRRGNITSNDIDIIFSKINAKTESKHLDKIIKLLEPSQTKFEKLNQNTKSFDKPILIDSFINPPYTKKYMGIACLGEDYPYRRIDIRFVPYQSYYSAILYFTGNADLNTTMRKKAKSMGYKLSEYGLVSIDNPNTKIPIKSEEDIFKLIEMDYLKPSERQ
jgi:DNA polymerase beta